MEYQIELEQLIKLLEEDQNAWRYRTCLAELDDLKKSDDIQIIVVIVEEERENYVTEFQVWQSQFQGHANSDFSGDQVIWTHTVMPKDGEHPKWEERDATQ